MDRRRSWRALQSVLTRHGFCEMRIGRHRNSSRARDFLSELRTGKNPATPRTQIHPYWKSLGPGGKSTRGSRNNVFSSLIWRKVLRTAVASAISDTQNSRPTTAERGFLTARAAAVQSARRRARPSKTSGLIVSLSREHHTHVIGAGRGGSFTNPIPVASPASVAGGIDIGTIVRRCHDQHGIAIDVDVG
jgi:hypothetical protein